MILPEGAACTKGRGCYRRKARETRDESEEVGRGQVIRHLEPHKGFWPLSHWVTIFQSLSSPTIIFKDPDISLASDCFILLTTPSQLAWMSQMHRNCNPDVTQSSAESA